MIADAQRAVERVDRAVALGGAHVALAVDPDLDRRLGLDLAVGALLDDRAPRLEPEQRLVAAGLLAQQQLERAVGGLELVAVVLELLDALEDARRAVVVELEAGRSRPSRRPCRAPESSETSRSRRLPTSAGSTCSKVVASARMPAACSPALCAKACLPTYGWPTSGGRLSSSSTKCAVSVSRASCSGASTLDAHLQLEVGDDRDEVRVAGALADAVDRALHLRRAGLDRDERVGDGAAAVVVPVDAERDVRQRLAHLGDDRRDLRRQRAAVGVAQHERSAPAPAAARRQSSA